MMRQTFAAVVVLCLALIGVAGAQASSQVIGSLSNFDVYNQTGSSCDGFEVTLTGVAPSDVYHEYNNPDFGVPAVQASGSDTVVTYSGHAVSDGAVEHFGVSFSANAPKSVKYRWTFHGNDCSGSSLTSDVQFPDTSASLNGNSLSTDVTNNSPDAQPIWVQRRILNANRAVSLEELMTNNPVYTDGTEIDSSPEMLEPGQSLSNDDQLETGDRLESVVAATDVYADDHGQPGVKLGTIIDAALTSRAGSGACSTLKSISLKPSTGKGGAVRPTGVVHLAKKAPAAGLVILLSSDSPNLASVPTSVTIPGGSTSARFKVSTHPVPELETVDIQAACGSIDLSAQLTLTVQ